jgi:hypothetical protein
MAAGSTVKVDLVRNGETTELTFMKTDKKGICDSYVYLGRIPKIEIHIAERRLEDRYQVMERFGMELLYGGNGTFYFSLDDPIEDSLCLRFNFVGRGMTESAKTFHTMVAVTSFINTLYGV